MEVKVLRQPYDHGVGKNTRSYFKKCTSLPHFKFMLLGKIIKNKDTTSDLIKLLDCGKAC